MTSHPARLGRASAAAIAPSKLRSASVSSGRSTCRRSTPSWWRNTMISRSFERRERTVSRASDARNRYEIRYTRTLYRPASRQVNDHGRVSGTHTTPYHERSGPPTCGTSPATRAPHPSQQRPTPGVAPTTTANNPREHDPANPGRRTGTQPRQRLAPGGCRSFTPCSEAWQAPRLELSRSVYPRVTQPKAATISAR